jgi:hypothetical protein
MKSFFIGVSGLLRGKFNGKSTGKDSADIKGGFPVRAEKREGFSLFF